MRTWNADLDRFDIFCAFCEGEMEAHEEAGVFQNVGDPDWHVAHVLCIRAAQQLAVQTAALN